MWETVENAVEACQLEYEGRGRVPKDNGTIETRVRKNSWLGWGRVFTSAIGHQLTHSSLANLPCITIKTKHYFNN